MTIPERTGCILFNRFSNCFNNIHSCLILVWQLHLTEKERFFNDNHFFNEFIGGKFLKSWRSMVFLSMMSKTWKKCKKVHLYLLPMSNDGHAQISTHIYYHRDIAALKFINRMKDIFAFCVITWFVCFIDGQPLEFNPEHLLPGRDYKQYVNDPVQSSEVIINHLTNDAPITNLIYAPNVLGNDAIIGLALFPNFGQGFRRFVGSLRYFGYDGHIMLGVSPDLPPPTLQYLKQMNTTLYGVEKTDCASSAVGSVVRGAIRGKCSKDLPDLKLEWGRFEMARRWLRACSECTGWVMVMDTRDSFFQAHPVRNYMGMGGGGSEAAICYLHI